VKQKFERIIRNIAGIDNSCESVSKITIPEQFCSEEKQSASIARNLNAAFLIILSGAEQPLYNQAVDYLKNFLSHPIFGGIASFYREGLGLVSSEISERCSFDSRFKKALTALYEWFIRPENLKNNQETLKKIHSVFFPEGVSLSAKTEREEKTRLLSEKRTIRIFQLNQNPISDPAKEILFASNILITLPLDSTDIDNLDVSSNLKQMLKQIQREEQLFWYDHPIPVGTTPEENEVLYGVKGLNEAVGFEKQRGTVKKDAKIDCILSASVTHKGLQGIMREYLEHEFKKGKSIEHVTIYVLTEADTLSLVKEIFIPAAKKYSNNKEVHLLSEIIGVDGEYGRHYSFLKAIAAFWNICINNDIKATFKIDLDQVFPQRELVEQTGSSAFEHLKTPLWGAEGIDNEGNGVELGMIAGALVDKSDIDESLFRPDISFPFQDAKADELIFFSQFPQALSTRAEMMTRYTDKGIDGKKQCLQRIHVTGGTSGILIDSLRKYRPFTPTFIGRAEDQAYILSVLFQDSQKYLRYVHKDGLIMRHDKEAFAGDAIKNAATGKLIGDYIRILLFSYYVRILPWSFEKTKDILDPFTGCFVSRIPLTVVYLRFALKAASFFADDRDGKHNEGFVFLQTGSGRLRNIIKNLTKEPNPISEKYQREKHAWNLYYDILNKIEEGIRRKDNFAIELQKKAQTIINECRIKFEN
jgi:hypothetical protein